MLANVSDSDSGLTAAVMLRRPVKRMPKPIAIEPMVSDWRVLTAIRKRMPMIAARGASVEGLKKLSSDVSDAFTSRRRMIWPVIVVPTFAPRMTPIDWCSDITPAPTRPDVSTIVAVELWMTAVTTRPSRKPTSGLFVTFSIARLKASDEPFFSPSPIRRMPYRNSARPPKRVIKLKIVISVSNLFFCIMPPRGAGFGL